MKKLKILELFGGISAPHQALINLGVEVETIDYVENDKKVVEIRNIMYGTDYIPKSVIDYHCDEEVDLLIGGSPCQDFSQAGLKMGGEEGSGTRSSLIWEQLRILTETKPKYYIWENVKGVLNKKHIDIFKKHNDYVESIGYKVYYQVLNAKEFGIPQNRERVFIVAIRNDIKQEFNFENLETKPMKPLKDFLETPNDLWYYVKQKHKWVEDRLIGSSETYTNTVITEQWKGNNQGMVIENIKECSNFINYPRTSDNKLVNGAYNRVWKSEKNIGAIASSNIPKILEQTEENSFIKMSDGTTRPTFKESENGIITLPISNNFTSCKVSTGNKAIQTLTTQGNTKILEISRQKIITDLKDPYFHTRPIKTKEYLSTITAGQAHFNHRANENKLLEPKFDNDLLVVEWNNKLWNVRILTEWEAFSLMGFKKEYVDLLYLKGIKRTKMYHVAGNSIVVDVLEAIFKELLK